MYSNIRHFANLTPLRFLAAYLVVLFHIEETRKMFGMPNLTDYSVFAHGQLAVTFFFVLSGFLITYLLLREQMQTSDVSVKRFYVRRALRIWPLYYFMVFIGLVLIPIGVKLGRVPYDAPFKPENVALYFIAFLPFVVNLQYGNHFLTPLWSVGIEEVFYLGWGPMMKFVRRWLLPIMVGIVAIKSLVVIWALRSGAGAQTTEVLRMLQFEAMAMGGIAAYFVFHRKQPIESAWLFSPPVQIAIAAVFAARLVAHKSIAAASPVYAAVFDNGVLTPVIMTALFAWFIVNVTVNSRNLFHLESRLLNYLGEISYGIYMYHALVISFVFVPFLKEYREMPAWVATLLVHGLVGVLTIVFAALSKRYFEDRFLRLKDKLQPIDTGAMSPAVAMEMADATASKRAA